MHVLATAGLSSVHAVLLQQPAANLNLDNVTKRLLGELTIGEVIQMTPTQLAALKSTKSPRLSIGTVRRKNLATALQNSGLDRLGITPDADGWYAVVLLEEEERKQCATLRGARKLLGWRKNHLKDRPADDLAIEMRLNIEDLHDAQSREDRLRCAAWHTLLNAAQAAIA